MLHRGAILETLQTPSLDIVVYVGKSQGICCIWVTYCDANVAVCTGTHLSVSIGE